MPINVFFCHCSFSSDVVLIHDQTVVLTYIAGFIAIAGLYLDKAREFIMAYLIQFIIPALSSLVNIKIPPHCFQNALHQISWFYAKYRSMNNKENRVSHIIK